MHSHFWFHLGWSLIVSRLEVIFWNQCNIFAWSSNAKLPDSLVLHYLRAKVILSGSAATSLALGFILKPRSENRGLSRLLTIDHEGFTTIHIWDKLLFFRCLQLHLCWGDPAHDPDTFLVVSVWENFRRCERHPRRWWELVGASCCRLITLTRNISSESQLGIKLHSPATGCSWSLCAFNILIVGREEPKYFRIVQVIRCLCYRAAPWATCSWINLIVRGGATLRRNRPSLVKSRCGFVT